MDKLAEEPLCTDGSVLPFLQKKEELDAANALCEVEDTGGQFELEDNQRSIELGLTCRTPVLRNHPRHSEDGGHTANFEMSGAGAASPLT